MNEIEENSYYNQGLEAEEKRNYAKAIELYLLASLEEKENLVNIYSHLAFVLHRRKSYEASCDAFLLKKGTTLCLDKNSQDEEEKNRKILYEYMTNKKTFELSDWLFLAKKAEALKCWNISEYAYKEFLARNEKFDFSFYEKLGHIYMQNKKYKEASFAFQEKNMRLILETFPLEEHIILYEGDELKESTEKLYALYQGFNNDAHFDAYQHVLVGEYLGRAFQNLGINKSTFFISKESDLYFAYLAKSKYLIATQNFSTDFKRKPQQFFLLLSEKVTSKEVTHLMTKKMSTYETIEEIFFQNKKVAFELQNKDEQLIKLYYSAIDDFNNELWESSNKKFIKVKAESQDIVGELPTLYYIKESEARYKIEHENKKMEELLSYKHYRFTAENFVGIEYLLKKAIQNSTSNTVQWKSIYLSFLEILEDIKKNKTKNIRSILDKEFLNKVYNFSKFFNNSLEAKLLPYIVWFVFANLFIFTRLYSKYQLARDKALNSILEIDKSDNINLLRYKLNAFGEKEDVKNYRMLRDNLLLKDSQYIQKELSLLGSLELYFNEQTKSKNFYKPFYTEDEKKFSEYIKNKTVGIVGPVSSHLKVGEEIDSHDVILRFNYKGLDKSLQESVGSKTNISFYISEILVPNRFDSDKVLNMNELDWIIFDKAHKKDSPCFMGITSNKRAGYFTADPFSNPYFKGTPSGIQRAILDLLRFNVKKIKVYNTNLFLENNYDKDYKSRGALGADHFNFIWHDPLSNFIFLKRLKEFNIIETDEVLAKILELTATEYIEALEERYGRENNGTQ